jgi:TetR/AcrR family transcriptional regulator, transcriptional repressor for nem operon
VNLHEPKKQHVSGLGRPREFDEDAVLSAAAKAFWENGYHATSIDDLCEATGLLRGSLYGAYRDKKGILLAALTRYSEGRITRLADSLKATHPSRETLRQALLYYIQTATDLDRVRACFITNTALELTPHDREVAVLIERIFRRMAAVWAVAAARAQADGYFNPKLDKHTIGNLLLCVVQGLRVMGKICDQQELIAIVDMTLRGLE